MMNHWILECTIQGLIFYTIQGVVSNFGHIQRERHKMPHTSETISSYWTTVPRVRKINNDAGPNRPSLSCIMLTWVSKICDLVSTMLFLYQQSNAWPLWYTSLRLIVWCMYLEMPACWAEGLSVLLSVVLSGWNWGPYQQVKAPSTSVRHTRLIPVCQPCLHWESVVGNLQWKTQIKMHKVTLTVQCKNTACFSCGMIHVRKVLPFFLKRTFTRRLIHLKRRIQPDVVWNQQKQQQK